MLPKVPEGKRCFIGGKTGCGKTTLAKVLLTDLQYNQDSEKILIIDPKGTFDYDGLIVTSPEEISRNKNEWVLIYRPDWNNTAKEDLDKYERILKWVMINGNMVCYIDEAYALAPDGNTYPETIRAIYTRGREFNITAIAASQRPVSIPRVMYTESDEFYCFELRAKSDRERMAEMMGPKALIMAKEHNFWYSGDQSDDTVYARLQLPH